MTPSTENDRNEVGALILAGGWIESLYILTQALRELTKQQEIINRIGEQKHPLDNLVEVLSPYYYKSAEFSEFVDMLIDLNFMSLTELFTPTHTKSPRLMWRIKLFT